MNSKTLFLLSLSFLAKALATSGGGNDGGNLTGGINKAKEEMFGDNSGGSSGNPLGGNSSQLGECDGDGNSGKGDGEDE
ncbi:hypothetical protein KMI_01g00600 [Encephalitozoon hellem]|nr:hypothetical protein KMI_01g00600 [Encephalitozoon hellem]